MLLVESQQTDETSAVVYIHFEENQCWTNHGAELIEESLPFTDVSRSIYFWWLVKLPMLFGRIFGDLFSNLKEPCAHTH